VIGSRNAPYLNRLARRGALETRYYAITHPSLPNYIALTTGSTRGVRGNCSRCAAEGPSLLNQLNAAGVDWGAYFQSLPHDKDVGPSAKLRYNRHYNPFVYTESLAGSIDQSRLRGFKALKRDIAQHSLPRFTWIAPNVRNDGHNHSLRSADRAAARLVPEVLRALGPHGVLYLTWDESVDRDVRGLHGGRGGGRVVLIAAGGLARHHARVARPATHIALLRTIEANFGLPELPGVSDAHAPLLTGLLR
jgi:phosphatidylinositol-3-phosphatase